MGIITPRVKIIAALDCAMSFRVAALALKPKNSGRMSSPGWVSRTFSTTRRNFDTSEGLTLGFLHRRLGNLQPADGALHFVLRLREVFNALFRALLGLGKLVHHLGELVEIGTGHEFGMRLDQHLA